MTIRIYRCPDEMTDNICEICGHRIVEVIIQEYRPGGGYMFAHEECLEDVIRSEYKRQQEHICAVCGQDDRSGVHGLKIIGGGWLEPPEYYCLPERDEEKDE